MKDYSSHFSDAGAKARTQQPSPSTCDSVLRAQGAGVGSYDRGVLACVRRAFGGASLIRKPWPSHGHGKRMGMKYVQLTSHLPLLTKVVQADAQFPSPQGLDPQPLCHLVQACPVKQNGTDQALVGGAAPGGDQGPVLSKKVRTKQRLKSRIS